MLRYLRTLSTARLILWCYAIWYAVVFVRYFDPNPQLWLTSLGLSAIIGVALLLSTSAAMPVGARVDRWGVFRLFLMPFCVSSFAALIKGHGFLLVFHPRWQDNLTAAAACATFVGVSALLRSLSGTVAGRNVSPGHRRREPLGEVLRRFGT